MSKRIVGLILVLALIATSGCATIPKVSDADKIYFQVNPEDLKVERPPLLYAALNVIPLLPIGQFAQGEIGDGILTMLGELLIPVFGIGLIPWVYGIMDAYVTAEAYNYEYSKKVMRETNPEKYDKAFR
ncbi:MAG: hypothetical protein ACUVXI_14310 [bacterium]